jgi:hypothetical protein
MRLDLLAGTGALEQREPWKPGVLGGNVVVPFTFCLNLTAGSVNLPPLPLSAVNEMKSFKSFRQCLNFYFVWGTLLYGACYTRRVMFSIFKTSHQSR